MGAVAAFLVLAVVGLRGQQEMTVRSSYIAMKLITDFMIVPLCFASLLTGIWQSLGTQWGLFRHYWIVFKLIITVLSTVILLLHTRPISFLGELAHHSALPTGAHSDMRLQLVVNATLAIVALLIAAVLAIYKPKGLTPYGLKVHGAPSKY